MHKLVILIDPLQDEAVFTALWPKFLHLAERMPGLQREATCHVEAVLFGEWRPALLHELYFDSLDAVQESMRSPDGQAAGQLLQQMTGGHLTLLIVDHQEDDLENIREHQMGASAGG
jgi:uncharacterized protein (TIGR02118 family)